MRLVRAVIRILSQNHHFDIVELSEAESVEHIFLWRINGDARLTLAGDGSQSIHKIGLLLFSCQHIMPG